MVIGVCLAGKPCRAIVSFMTIAFDAVHGSLSTIPIVCISLTTILVDEVIVLHRFGSAIISFTTISIGASFETLLIVPYSFFALFSSS